MSISKEMQDVDLARRYPNMSEEDRIIQGAIDVYEERDWNGHGWTENQGRNVCILESLNVARYGATKSSYRNIKKGVIERIHRAIYPDGRDPGYGMTTYKPNKEDLACDVMDWNDGGDAKSAGGKKAVVDVLKKALALGRKDS